MEAFFNEKRPTKIKSHSAHQGKIKIVGGPGLQQICFLWTLRWYCSNLTIYQRWKVLLWYHVCFVRWMIKFSTETGSWTIHFESYDQIERHVHRIMEDFHEAVYLESIIWFMADCTLRFCIEISSYSNFVSTHRW